MRHLPQRKLTEAPSPPPASPFSERVAAVGLVEASTENIAVGKHIGGIVHQVFVSAGQSVNTGDPLFEIDNRHLRAQLELQRTALAVAAAELADLENQLDRARPSPSRKSSASMSSTAAARRPDTPGTRRASRCGHESERNRSRPQPRRRADRWRDPETRRALRQFAAAGITPEPLLLLGRLVPLRLRVDVDEQEAWRVEPRAKAVAALLGDPSQQRTLEFVRFEPYVVPKRSLTGGSTEHVDTRVLQVIYRFKADSFSIHVGQQMDVFIEASPNSQITRKKLKPSVPNPLARRPIIES